MGKIVAGVVAEYNPFHNGHQYQLDCIRSFGAEYLVAVMSGNFVQRGEPACMPKFIRANAAVSCGLDVVLELPLPYALSGARRFAKGAVESLLAFGINLLSFGCECDDLSALSEAAALIDQESWIPLSKSFLEQGLSFPAARAKAVGQLYGSSFKTLIASPNNMLAISYLQALHDHDNKNASGKPIQILPVLRKGAAHDSSASHDSSIASASFLRDLLRSHDVSSVAPYVPAAAFSHYQTGLLCDSLRLELCALSRLRLMPFSAFENLPDCSEGLEHRLYHAVGDARHLSDLYHRVKSKRYTLSRVRRLIWNAVLSVPSHLQILPLPYLRLLALSEQGRRLLHSCTPSLPLSHSLKQLKEMGSSCEQFAALEAFSSDFYGMGFEPPLMRGIDLSLRLHRNL